MTEQEARALLEASGYKVTAPKEAEVTLTPDEAALLKKMTEQGKVKAFFKSDEGKAVKAAKREAGQSFRERLHDFAEAKWSAAIEKGDVSALTPYMVFSAIRAGRKAPKGLRFVGCHYKNAKGYEMPGAVLVNAENKVVSRATSGAGGFSRPAQPIFDLGKVDLPTPRQ